MILLFLIHTSRIQIKCVSLAIYYHIKNNANVIKEGRMKQDRTNFIMVDEGEDSSLEIFDERLHPLTVSDNLHSCLFPEDKSC